MKMEIFIRIWLCLALTAVFVFPSAMGEPGQSASHIGYVYPAGGRQGSKIEITAAGQGLRNVQHVYISGEGVKATVVRTIPNFKKTHIEYLRFLQKEARMKQRGDQKKGKGKKVTPTKKGKKGKSAADQKKKGKGKDDEMKPPPDHPIFRELEKCSYEELSVLIKRYYKENKQKNRQLDELVLMDLTVNPDAATGMREMRFRTSSGLSNPIRFFIGEKPEVYEKEPNEKSATNPLIHPPFILNGQILPGDVDRFQFSAKAGQSLLIQAHARSIIPYLADAVPGWFQATLTLFDSKGKELSYADDYRFSPDPVLFYKIPEDGNYTIEIRDSIYRGREDFVYRISIGEDPFITSIFPLGGKHGRKATVEMVGWNLPTMQVALDTRKEPGGAHSFQLKHSNEIPFAVDELPECLEAANNNTIKTAQEIQTPMIINGRIDTPGDVDVFKIKGREGERLIVDVNARRLHSPVDSKVKLTDASGKVIAWNDDTPQLNLGMLTHHADSRLSVQLPKAGTYYISMADTQGKGGVEYGYRLRLSRPHPDFSLTATPASITVKLGCTIPISVHVLRKDGFDGEIDLVLKDAPKGFRLSGATIPAGVEKVQMTLTAPRDAKNTLFEIRLQGRSKIDRGVVTRDVLPGQAMTQAFITQHVMPSQSFMVYVGGWGEVTELELSKNAHVRIPVGGETTLRVKKRKSDVKLILKLYQAPEGISLVEKRDSKNALSVLIKANKKVKPGISGNLMIEVLREQKAKNGKVRYSSLGVMPAVPFRVRIAERNKVP